ncbi:MAG: glycosyltransferase [Chromatiales bacterium]|nr:glycosyltransferase [Chromatiales bacterium]
MDDKRFKLIVNYENQGLPSARNLGILSTQMVIIYISWIQMIGSQLMRVEAVLKVALRDKVDIVIGGVAKYYDEDGRLEAPANHGKAMSVEAGWC